MAAVDFKSTVPLPLSWESRGCCDALDGNYNSFCCCVMFVSVYPWNLYACFQTHQHGGSTIFLWLSGYIPKVYMTGAMYCKCNRGHLVHNIGVTGVKRTSHSTDKHRLPVNWLARSWDVEREVYLAFHAHSYAGCHLLHRQALTIAIKLCGFLRGFLEWYYEILISSFQEKCLWMWTTVMLEKRGCGCGWHDCETH